VGEYEGEVGETLFPPLYAGDVGEYVGEVGVYAGLAGDPNRGLVTWYAGLVTPSKVGDDGE